MQRSTEHVRHSRSGSPRSTKPASVRTFTTISVINMAAVSSSSTATTLNFNVGVLGHIDSGKTALAKAVSTVSSTAAFDKNPQSRERGITLDLGFSSFTVPAPAQLSGTPYKNVQFTLVDCPGHASLIRTIIGGAQIIDLMLLVVDATKGIQTQTAECLVIGEVTCPHMIVVLNKIDLLEQDKRDSLIAKVSRRITKTLSTTRYADALIVPVAARPGGPEDASSSPSPIGVDKLIQALSERVFIPHRSPDGPLVFSVDHCFPIRGQGTVMTGTVLSGRVAVSDVVEIPFLKVTRKIKSMQMFRQPVEQAVQGDRVGLCVTHFDAKQVERCLVSTPGHLTAIYAGVFRVWKVHYHKMECKTGAKIHVTVGHETLMARTTFFASDAPSSDPALFDLSCDYHYQDVLADTTPATTSQYVLLEFERPVICPHNCIAIGSRLDADAFSHMCRIALHGTMLLPIIDKDYEKTFLPKLKIYKLKHREGTVERLQDANTVIGRGLFKKQTKLDAFIGLTVHLSTGEIGKIDGSFGTAGKFRVSISNGVLPHTQEQLTRKKGKGATTATQADDGDHKPVQILLNFKRYIFDPLKSMHQ